MMKAADSRLRPDRAVQIRSHFGQSSAGRLFFQSEMRSVILVIADVLEAEAHQMSVILVNLNSLPAYRIGESAERFANGKNANY